MFYRLIISIVIATSICGFSQPAVEWVRSYGGNTYDYFEDIYAVSNGDYVMCGQIGLQNSNWWVIRVDQIGNEVWSNEYGDGDAHSLIETDDGNFLIGGKGDGGKTALLVDGEGERIWQSSYGRGEINAVIELKSGEFLLAGKTYAENNNRAYLAMIDGDGDTIWDRTYFFRNGGSSFHSMRESEGSVMLAGGGGLIVKADIEREGAVIASRIYEEFRYFLSIASVPQGGFVLTGSYSDPMRHRARMSFCILNVDDDCQEEWMSVPHDVGDSEWGRSVVSIDDNGFVGVGRRYIGENEDGSLPFAVRTNSQGVMRWQLEFELDGIAEEPWDCFRSVIVEDAGSILAAGSVDWDDERGLDGLVIKLGPDIPEPMILYYAPEDTVFSVLQGDTVQFIARAIDQAGQELEYEWFMNDTLVGEDTTTTVIFEELGENSVICVISNDDFSSSIRWHVTAEDWYIDTHTPDSLAWTIRRPREVDFELGVRAIEGIEPRYRWILTGHRGAREDVGDAPNLTYEFDRPGEYSLEGRAFHDGTVHSVTWQIAVRSVLYWWTPHDREFTVDQHDEIEFNLLPFNPNSDSLDFQWFIDDEHDENELDAGLFYSFGDLGDHSVTAIVHDGVEVDTVIWSITVEDPNAVEDGTEGLLPTEVTLYPAAPNPFNSTTRVRYFLPRSADVRLTVYDSAGRLIQILSEDWTVAGEHRATLHGSELPAGVYLLKLEAADVVRSMKVVLLK